MKRDANSPAESEKNKKMASDKSSSPTSALQIGLDEVREELKEGIGSLTTKLGEVFFAHSQSLGAINFHGQHIAGLNAELSALKLEVKEKDQIINKLSRNYSDSLSRMKRDVDENTKERKNKNMVINGLQENPNENCLSVVVEFLKRLVPSITAKDIMTVYRLGKKISGTGSMSRSIMVRFKDPLVKIEVMKKKSSLKDSAQNKGIFCNDDLPEEQRRTRQKLREIGKFALKNGYDNVMVKGDKIWVEGKMFTGNELHLLPVNLQPENISTRIVGNGIGFSGESSYLSNFYPCNVRMENKSFCSAEQAFQYTKCVICEREDAGVYVMQVQDPAVIKSMGGKVFTTVEWEMKKSDMMKCILISKFNQNPELKAKLNATGSTPLYECTQSRFWGAGWLIDSPQWEKTSNFPGKNVLGKLLMEIRDNVEGSVNLVTASKLHEECLKEAKEREEPSEMETGSPKKIDGDENTVNIPIVDTTKPPTPTDGCDKAAEVEGVPAQVSDSESGKSDICSGGIEEVNTSMKNQENSNQVDGMLSHDSISFNSSTYLSENTSFTRKNVSRPDGGLDVNKLMNWTLPVLDTSVLHIPKGGHKSYTFNPSEEATAVSTPILIAKNLNKFKQRKKSTTCSYGSSNSKAAMLALMNKMLNK